MKYTKQMSIVFLVVLLAMSLVACAPAENETATTTVASTTQDSEALASETAAAETTLQETSTSEETSETTAAQTTTAEVTTTGETASETTAVADSTTVNEPVTAAEVGESSKLAEMYDVPNGQPVVSIATKIGEDALGDMVLALDPNSAPNTVANFIALAEDGYYDGLIFHRIIKDFMIQGGDPTGTGRGGPGYGIYGEFSGNGFENDISHERGVISMARSQHPNSAGSQFFICHQAATFLDGQYAAFGKLVGGEDALDALATTETGAADRPTSDCVIVKITVELNGYQPPAVEKLQ